MKNLPDKFPIRYALIVRCPEEEDWDDINFFNSQLQQREALFRQLIFSLQQKALSKEMLLIQATAVKFTLLNVEIVNIAKLGGSMDWIELTKKSIKNILPEAKFKSWSSGEAFTLGLYSYKGNYEIPAFVRGHNKKDNFKYIDEKFGFLESRKVFDFFFDTYTKMKKGELKDWELYERLNKYEKPIYITSYYSDLWKLLDDGGLNGSIRPDHLFQFKSRRIKELKEVNEYNQKISIAVCKNWESLFAEEISALYKMSRFCHNCGEALPFDYQGNYCPDTKENEHCIRERARIRARKKRKKSQI